MAQISNLKCEFHNGPVDGICTAKQCPASDRILCLQCLKEFHRDCKTYLSQHELFQELEQAETDLGQLLAVTISKDQISILKTQLIQQLDSYEKKVELQQMNLRNIQKILQASWTKDLWNEGYDLLLQLPQATQSFKKSINEIVKKVQDLQYLVDQIKLDNNEYQQKKKVCLQKPLQEQIIQTDFNDPYAILAIAYSKDGNSIACGGANTIKIYDTKTFQQLGQNMVTLHNSHINSIQYSNNGEFIVTANSDQTATIWDPKQYKMTVRLLAHQSSVNVIAISPNDLQFATGGQDKIIQFWNFKDLKKASKPLASHELSVTALAYSPNGKVVASGSGDKQIKLWNAQTANEFPYSLKGHQQQVKCIQFSLNSDLLISGDDDGDIIIWQVLSARIFRQINAYFEGLQSVRLSPDNTSILSINHQGCIKTWTSILGEADTRYHQKQICAVDYSPDGQNIVLACYGNQIIFTPK